MKIHQLISMLLSIEDQNKEVVIQHEQSVDVYCEVLGFHDDLRYDVDDDGALMDEDDFKDLCEKGGASPDDGVPAIQLWCD